MKRDFLDSKKRCLCIPPVCVLLFLFFLFFLFLLYLFVVVVVVGLFVVLVCLFREEDDRSQELDGFLY